MSQPFMTADPLPGTGYRAFRNISTSLHRRCNVQKGAKMNAFASGDKVD
jgi:hypothetical protein